MEATRDIVSSDAVIEKMLEKITEHVTNNVNGLHLLREEVAAVSQQQRDEESQLRDLQKKRNQIASEDKMTREDEDTAFNQYQMQLGELEKEMDKHREEAISSEVNEKVLTALRDLVAQEENELIALRRDKQWTPNAENFCAPAFANAAISFQISTDLKEVTKKAQELKSELQRLHCKRIEAAKIVSEVRAYTETEKSARLDMECRLHVMRVERKGMEVVPGELRGAATSSQQVRSIPMEKSPLLSEVKQSETRFAIFKELEEEKFRGRNLMKEIQETMQLAAKHAAERKEWLRRQFL